MELIDLTELQQVLQDLANDIRDNYKEHLQFNDRYTERGVPTGYSQKLIDSVKTQVVVGDQAYEVTMTLNDSLEQDPGVGGNQACHPKTIVKWQNPLTQTTCIPHWQGNL